MFSTRRQSVFLLGAGFNVDVEKDIESRIAKDYKYPLIDDIKKICGYPDSCSNVEELLANDIKNDNCQRWGIICKQIMGADYYLLPKLFESKGCYYKFFEKFKGNQFLTFNYDSFVEYFLMKLGCWNPREGYGIPIKADKTLCRRCAGHEVCPHIENLNGSSKVLHLHGTFCVCTSEPWEEVLNHSGESLIQDRKKPLYVFDPGTINGLFSNYKSCTDFKNFDPHQERGRVIAPIPDKSEGLVRSFIKEMYASAIDLIKESGELIVIGYSFNLHDKSSYEPLIDALAQADNPSMQLVSPNAKNNHIVSYVKSKGIKLICKNQTFEQWFKDIMDGGRSEC